MSIDFYISNISDDKIIGSGFEKKCYDFIDVVLLESRFLTKRMVDSELKKISRIKEILDFIDVNSYKIYDYKVFNDKLYILENKVKGSSLQNIDFNFSVNDYIEKLDELDNYNILRKFVSDSFTILNNGLYIDFGKPNNFLFDKENGISFIDLSVCDSEFDLKYVCFYIFYNLIYTHCDIENLDNYNIISSYYYSIYDKLCSIFIELGFKNEMYSMSPNGTIMSFIERKLNNLLKFSNIVETKKY